MSRAARSLFVFGIYVAVVGVLFLAAPQTMIDVLSLPDATDGWVRVVGLLALVIAAYDIASARAGFRAYFRASVWVRVGFASGVAILVLTGQMPSSLLPLGAVDVAGAIWTALALRPRTALRTAVAA